MLQEVQNPDVQVEDEVQHDVKVPVADTQVMKSVNHMHENLNV